MTSEEAYLKFLQKVNKNYTNDNISVDRGRFVHIFNESQDKFIDWTLEKRNEDDIRNIQRLIVRDKKLKQGQKLSEAICFTLPSDFHSFNNVKAFASKGSCQNQKLLLFEIKHENEEEVIFDEFNKPSFEFREAPYTIGDDSVNIFNADFTLDKVLLNYYRTPVQIDLNGYIKIDNTPSTNVDPELPDETVDRILSIAAKEFNIDSENLNRIQIDKDRIVSDF